MGNKIPLVFLIVYVANYRVGAMARYFIHSASSEYIYRVINALLLIIGIQSDSVIKSCDIQFMYYQLLHNNSICSYMFRLRSAETCRSI
jgi:hypothetical protein